MEERFSKAKLICLEWPPSYLSAREDMISKLPDSLICQILLQLPTKDIVRTSVLSKRWKSVWLLIPGLDLDANEFPNYNAFVSFIDRFLDFSREEKSCLHKLKLSIRKDVNDPPCVSRWIDFVVRRKLWHLDVECLVNRKFLEEMPLSLYICDTLAYLRLHRVWLGKFESVSLPCLKTMRLEENVYANDVCLESLISSCPVLEDLSIVRMVEDNVKVLRVHSQTLTSLHIDFRFGEGDDYVDGFDKEHSGVLIDAPRLKYLKFEDDLSESKIITNSGSLAKVNVVYVFNENDCADVVDLPKRNMVRNFLTSISGVRDMKISGHFLEFIHYNMDFDPLPQFCNLSRLKATFYLPLLDMLPTLLESCPNLKSLVLDFDPWEEDVQIRLSSVPQCLLSSLEFVEIKYFNGGPAKMEVARTWCSRSCKIKTVSPSHDLFSTSPLFFNNIEDLQKPSHIFLLNWEGDEERRLKRQKPKKVAGGFFQPNFFSLLRRFFRRLFLFAPVKMEIPSIADITLQTLENVAADISPPPSHEVYVSRTFQSALPN